jgi:hypothetical protein
MLHYGAAGGASSAVRGGWKMPHVIPQIVSMPLGLWADDGHVDMLPGIDPALAICLCAPDGASPPVTMRHTPGRGRLVAPNDWFSCHEVQP